MITHANYASAQQLTASVQDVLEVDERVYTNLHGVLIDNNAFSSIPGNQCSHSSIDIVERRAYGNDQAVP
jgi:predicted phosphohydrolase